MAAKMDYLVRNVSLDEIFVIGDRREVDDAAVNSLMQSIESIGLQTPITVRSEKEVPHPETGEVWVEAYILVAGRHRLEAYKRLGRKDIPAIERECSALEAEMWEIAENLHRADLSKAERDRQIVRYAELLKEREAGVSAQTAPKLSERGRINEGRPQGIASKVAEQTGLSKSTVNRALAAAKNPPAPKPPREPAIDKHGDPDMRVVAHRLGSKHTVGELQDLIDHLTDIVKDRIDQAA